MARVLFINGGSEGHINPTTGVVRELISRGEEVVYFCIEAYRERMEQAGAEVRTFDDQRFITAFISGGRHYALERINGLLLTADIVIPSVLEQIKGEQFDYIIHDSMFGCGRLLAQMLKLPAVCSCTSFAMDEAAFDRMMAPFYNDTSAHLAGPVIERFQRLAAKLAESYNVQPPTPYEAFCNPAPLTIVYTTKDFQPHGEAFDSAYAFVGPSLAPRAPGESFDFNALVGRSLIYISLGTVFNQSVEFYRLCIEAFGNAEHTVVMSIGNQVSVSELGEIPGNFIVKNYVPQTDVLARAKLFVTHGGMNSVHEGLYYGVPLVVIPQSADQPVIAGQVARSGAGVALPMHELTSGRLREAADQVLTRPSFRQAATKLQESFRQSGGYRKAVDAIFAHRARL